MLWIQRDRMKKERKILIFFLLFLVLKALLFFAAVLCIFNEGQLVWQIVSGGKPRLPTSLFPPPSSSTSSWLSFAHPLAPVSKPRYVLWIYVQISRSIILSWRQGWEVNWGMPWHREQGRAPCKALCILAHSLLRLLPFSPAQSACLISWSAQRPSNHPSYMPVLPEPTKPAHVIGAATKLPITLMTLV